jgi:ABC-2 type transport system ATP-binding protein
VTSARSIRRFIRDWLADRPGRTILLTTHYMTEADELCDRVAIIEGGRIVACDTPAALKRQVQRYPVFGLRLSPGPDGWRDPGPVPGVRQWTVTATPTEVDVKVALEEESAVGAVVQRVVESGARILALQKTEPTLEDAFIDLVGHALDAAEGKP